MTETALRSIVGDFVNQLSSALEAQILARVQTVVLSALGSPVKRGPGRPPKNGLAAAFITSASSSSATRKAAPKQLCPVPGCKNPAAPVFGMVCSEHKGLPKAKIKAYREARRQAKVSSKGSNGAGKRAAAASAKTGAAAAKPAPRKIRMTPKAAKARKLQGQYLGALRSLKDDARERVKKLAQEKGVAEAVKLAQSLAKN
jgi:hypothetical protein